MPGHNAKQRRILLAFLGRHPDELFSVRQIADALKAEQNAAMLAELLAQNEQFGLDRNSTVLYGTCSQCKGSRKEVRTT